MTTIGAHFVRLESTKFFFPCMQVNHFYFLFFGCSGLDDAYAEFAVVVDGAELWLFFSVPIWLVFDEQ